MYIYMHYKTLIKAHVQTHKLTEMYKLLRNILMHAVVGQANKH